MVDVDSYLKVIGFEGTAKPDLPTLRELQRRHVEVIPYRSDPGNPAMTEPIVNWDWDEVFARSIVAGRGGNCFELNEPFGILLRSIGFTVHRISASSRLPNGRYGPEIEHQALLVELDGESLLVDVGFGQPTPVYPTVINGEPQDQEGVCYRVVSDGEWRVCERQAAGGWVTVYRFKPCPRELAEWDFRSDEFLAMAKDIPIAQLRVVSRVVDGTTLTLSGKRLWTHAADRESTRMVLDRAEFDDLTRLILNEK